MYLVHCFVSDVSDVASYKVTKREIVRIIANIMIMAPILINLLLASACDIGIWWVLELLKRFFLADVVEDGEWFI